MEKTATAKLSVEIGVLVRNDFIRFLKGINHFNETDVKINFIEDKGLLNSTFYLTITGESTAVLQCVKHIKREIDKNNGQCLE